MKDFPKIGSIVEGVAPIIRDDGSRGIPWRGRVKRLYPGYRDPLEAGGPARHSNYDAIGVELIDPPKDWPYSSGTYAPSLGSVSLVRGEVVAWELVDAINAKAHICEKEYSDE